MQEQYVRRVGGSSDKKVDVRIIATLNDEPTKLIQTGQLRQDLFFRLSNLYVHIPPLRNRKKDISLLINYYINRYSNSYKIKPKKLGKDVITFLESYEWTGNVSKTARMLNIKRQTLHNKITKFKINKEYPEYD